jgi:hypothetical protein
VALGLGIGLGIVSISQASTAGLITGVTLGILIATPFILFATVISTYTATAYHLPFLWARDVERAPIRANRDGHCTWTVSQQPYSELKLLIGIGEICAPNTP